MKVWLPYTQGGSGSDVFTRMLETGLRERGTEVQSQAFAHKLQYAPWLLKSFEPPPGTNIVLANTWNGFAFKRHGAKLVTVEHLFVLDPALKPYRSFAQGVFHNTMVRHFERASMKASDVQVAVSRYAADTHHKELGGEKPRVILNGIDTDFFTPSDETRDSRGHRPIRLLFVGNLTRRKGIDLIAPIMEGLGQEVVLDYAVGLRTSESLASLPNARSLGRLGPKEVRAAYRRADLLLFPTRLEGLPLVAMEALACGTPVIATRGSSLPEVIEHGFNGLLCQQDDPASFVAAVASLAGNELRLNEMRANARESAERRFSLERMLDEYMSLFEELVSAA